MLSLFFTDKESKELLFKNNNIGMNEENKIDNNLILRIKKLENNHISTTSFVTILLSFDDILSSIIGLLLLLSFEDMLPSSSLYNA